MNYHPAALQPRALLTHVVHDLHRLGQQSDYEFLLLVVPPRSISDRPDVFASAIIENHMAELVSSDRIDLITHTVAQHRDSRQLSPDDYCAVCNAATPTSLASLDDIIWTNDDFGNMSRSLVSSVYLSNCPTSTAIPGLGHKAIYNNIPLDETFFLSSAQRSRPTPIAHSPDKLLPTPIQSADGTAAYHPLLLSDTSSVTSFLELKFRQLQQLVCKVVSKAWIKVIEPKKQTNHPYNKGDKFKPSWWPAQARHKEPDHLMKPERLILLMSMLRCDRVDVSQLRAATADYGVASIPSDKMELLEEIYYVAEMEERVRKGESLIDCSTESAGLRTSDVVIWTVSTSKLIPPNAGAAVAASVSSSSSTSSSSTSSLKRPASLMDFDPSRLSRSSPYNPTSSQSYNLSRSNRYFSRPLLCSTRSLEQDKDTSHQRLRDQNEQLSHGSDPQETPYHHQRQHLDMNLQNLETSPEVSLFTPRSEVDLSCQGPFDLISQRRYGSGAGSVSELLATYPTPTDDSFLSGQSPHTVHYKFANTQDTSSLLGPVFNSSHSWPPVSASVSTSSLSSISSQIPTVTVTGPRNHMSNTASHSSDTGFGSDEVDYSSVLESALHIPVPSHAKLQFGN
ncbi:hypothetical protein V1511DRAFT_159260 [Dipodascopsis uninucleata]